MLSKDVRRHRLISSDYITTLPCHRRGPAYYHGTFFLFRTHFGPALSCISAAVPPFEATVGLSGGNWLSLRSLPYFTSSSQAQTRRLHIRASLHRVAFPPSPEIVRLKSNQTKRKPAVLAGIVPPQERRAVRPPFLAAHFRHTFRSTICHDLPRSTF